MNKQISSNSHWWGCIVFLITGFIWSGLSVAALSVNPLTWNIIGLDSNDPINGPNRFPVGAEVCSNIDTSNVSVTLQFDSANPHINLSPGTLSSMGFTSIDAGTCVDAFFEVSISPVVAAFDTARTFHIAATDSTGTYVSPMPRELYVEHLIDQSRNHIDDLRFGTHPMNLTSVPPGGELVVIEGSTYLFELSGGTAPHGYEQFEMFLNLPNHTFEIQSITTSYSANSSPMVNNPNNGPYADACGWDNDPTSTTYRSCIGPAGRTGGNHVVTIYQVKIIGGAGSAQTLNSLLFDFSGSSYHYNGDFAAQQRIIRVLSADIAKDFQPSTLAVSEITNLTIQLSNPTAAALGDYAFIDELPAGLNIANPNNLILNGCGPALITADPGTNIIDFSQGVLSANSLCIISLDVTANSAASYTNVTNHLFVAGNDTGNTATATVEFVDANIQLTKTASPQTYTQVGNIIQYQFDVTNIGSVAISGPITILDDLTDDETCPALNTIGNLNNQLDPGESIVCQASHIITASDVNAASVINTATATNGIVVSNEDSATINLINPELSIVKTASANAFITGGSGSYNIVVSNNGAAATSTDIVIHDTLAPGIALTSFSGNDWSCAGINMLTCTYSGILLPGDSTHLTLVVGISAMAQHANNGVQITTGDPNCPALSRCESQVVVPVLAPLLNTVKTAVLDNTQVAPDYQSNPGDLIEYTISVNNSGTGPAIGVTVEDPLIPLLECTINAAVVNLPTTLAASESLICTGVYTLTEDDVSNQSVSNTATVTASNTCPPGSSCVGTTTTPLTTTPLLQISKTAEPERFIAGQIGAYHITVSNIGNAPTRDSIFVHDTLPTGIILNSIRASNWTCIGTVSLSCTYNDILSPGENTVLTLIVDISHDAVDGDNLATTHGGGDPGCPDDDRCTDQVQVRINRPVLNIIKSGILDNTVVAPDDQSNPGDLIHYTVMVHNSGTGPAYQVMVTDPLLTSMDCTISAIDVTLPTTLNAGDSLVCTGEYALTDSDLISGDVTNVAIYTTDNGCPPGPICMSTTTTPLSTSPSLFITKTASPSPFIMGEQGQYFITIENRGFRETEGVITVSDLMAPGIDILSYSGDDWVCTEAMNYSCEFSGVLAPNESTSITLTVYVSTAADTGNNTAIVRGGGDPGCPAQKHCSDTVVVEILGPDLIIDKFHHGNFYQGQTDAEYTIIVTNINSSHTVGEVTIFDIMPSGMTPTSISGEGWACSLAFLTCSRSDILPAGESYPPIYVVVTVDMNAPTSMINFVEVMGGGDQDPTNNTDSDPVIVFVGTPIAVPINSFWMLIIMAAAMFIMGHTAMRKRLRNE